MAPHFRISIFTALELALHEALRTRVESSYQGFNESVGVYRQVVSSLKSTHESIQVSKAELDKVSEQFSMKPILKEYHQESLRHKRKLEILTDLEILHQIAPTYEANALTQNCLRCGICHGMRREGHL